MASDEFAWIRIDEDALVRARPTARVGARKGPWLQVESLSEVDARQLSERAPEPVVHCVVHTAVSLAWIQVFAAGRCVREVLSSSDDGWMASGKALPFEGRAALRALAKRRNAGGHVDPHDVVEAFLGLAPEPVRVPRAPTAKRGPPPLRGVVPMPDGVSSGDDEDRFKPRAAWALALDRRRGGWFAEPPLAVDPEGAALAALAAFGKTLSLWAPASRDPSRRNAELTELMRAVTARFASPVSAAQVGSAAEEGARAVMLRIAYDERTPARAESPLVPLWIARGGLSFAVESTLAAFDLGLGGHPWYLHTPGGGTALLIGPGLSVARTLRRHLAAAAPADFEAARDRCAALRGPPQRPGVRREVVDMRPRIAASYLFPAEQGWLAEVLAEKPITWPNHEVSSWIYASQTRSPFAENVTFGDEGVPHVPAMLEAFGRGFEEHLSREIGWRVAMKRPGGGAALEMLGDALASTPTDEAMQALARWRREKPIGKRLAVAISSYPRRAARLGIDAG